MSEKESANDSFHSRISSLIQSTTLKQSGKRVLQIQIPKVTVKGKNTVYHIVISKTSLQVEEGRVDSPPPFKLARRSSQDEEGRLTDANEEEKKDLGHRPAGVPEARRSGQHTIAKTYQ